jgi:hypothetical protein
MDSLWSLSAMAEDEAAGVLNVLHKTAETTDAAPSREAVGEAGVIIHPATRVP